MNLNFKDLAPTFNVEAAYYTTNEDPLLHSLLLRTHLTQEGRRAPQFKKVGSIASGGEVPLFVLLPLSKEVLAIDHSYKSLAVTAIKMGLLERLGPRAYKALMVESPLLDIKAALMGEIAGLPEPLRVKAPTPTELSDYQMNPIRTEVFHTPDKILERVHPRLSKVTLLHGDLIDLGAEGAPLDGLYISNAPGHSGRLGVGGTAITLAKMAPLVKPEGFLLVTYSTPTQTEGWTLKKSMKGFRSAGTDHALFVRQATASPQVPFLEKVG